MFHQRYDVPWGSNHWRAPLKVFTKYPSRVPMGDLQPDTFRKTAEGFEVYYRSGDFSMKMDLKEDSMYAMERYKNTELLYYIGGAKMFIGPRMTQLRLGPSVEADQLIGSDLAEFGNIKYSPFGDAMKVGSSNSFPDGFLMSIVVSAGNKRYRVPKPEELLQGPAA